MSEKVAIVGGGLTGLTIALRLSQKGKQVTVYEKEKDLGGLAGSFDLAGGKIEKSYHHIFKSDKSIINLIEELGLGEKLKWEKSSVAQYYRGKFFPFVGVVDLLKFKPLKMIDKIRLGLIYLYLQKTNKWEGMKKRGAAEWMRKWAGEKNWQVIWEPLLRGKFHQYYDRVSMAWLWARINVRGKSKDSEGEKLGYLLGGFDQLVEKMKSEIEKKGGKIKLGVAAKKIKKIKNKIRVGDEMFDKVVACVSSDKFYDLTQTNKKLLDITYLGFIDVVFSSKQNLSPYYWHNIADKQSPFLALIQQTNFIDKKNYNNRHIYYLGNYLPQNDAYFQARDEVIYKDFFDYLIKIFPDFDKKLVEEKRVFKFKWAQHLADRNYDKKIPKYKTGLKNVYLANFSQIFPQDRGMNYAISEGEKVARMI
ncbi:NAD(P)/FAD-dependent oxidoreductase [Patescibacteria group bacterium]|nr:NAD(P)/FAD-dependent oxidoreductase [Patescibacteria group bacterium]